MFFPFLRGSLSCLKSETDQENRTDITRATTKKQKMRHENENQRKVSPVHASEDASPIKVNVKYILADDSRKSEFIETPL